MHVCNSCKKHLIPIVIPPATQRNGQTIGNEKEEKEEEKLMAIAIKSCLLPDKFNLMPEREKKTADDALHRSINACRHCVEPCAIPFEGALLNTIVTLNSIENSNGFCLVKIKRKRINFY